MSSENENILLALYTLVYVDKVADSTLKERESVYNVVNKFDEISTKENLIVNQDNVITMSGLL